jgi:hypothetical protein
MQMIAPLVALAGMAALAWRGHRLGWAPGAALEYLIGAHLLLFASGKIFHNNYLVWIVPLMGIALAETWSQGKVSHGSLSGARQGG